MHHLSFAPGSRFVLRSGTGVARRALNAFDAALVSAGVGNYNLIKVSSILPPGAVEGSEIPLIAGSRLPIAYGAQLAEEPGHRISASVSVAVPMDDSINGVIMEFHAHGTAADADRIVREMAEEAMELRGIKIKKILSTAVEALSGEQPTCVFASVALIPHDAL